MTVTISEFEQIISKKFSEKVSRRFIRNIRVQESGCWKWIGYFNDMKYGKFKFLGKTKPSHRLSYYFYYGNIKSSESVCHKCNYRLCVNPLHLFLGSIQDNSRHMKLCGRSTRDSHFCDVKDSKYHIDLFEVIPKYAAPLASKFFSAMPRSLCYKILKKITFPEVKDKCWNWNGNVNCYGYGRIGIKRKNILSHRFIWEIMNGEIPSGMCILHQCDNPLCVNVFSHLRLGTQIDNIADCVKKGRNRLPIVNPVGENNPRSKLSENSIREIRKLGSLGFSSSEISNMFPVASSMIRRIISKKAWKHVV